MKIMLCSRPKGCCPSIETIGSEITITDDHNGSVRFTLEEWEILKEKINLGVV